MKNIDPCYDCAKTDNKFENLSKEDQDFLKNLKRKNKMEKYICWLCNEITIRKDDGSEDVEHCTKKGCHGYVYSAEELTDDIG